MKAKPAKSMKLHKPANSKPAKTMKAKHDKSMKAKPATSMKAKPAKLSMNSMKAKPMNAMKAKSMNAMKAKPDKSKKTVRHRVQLPNLRMHPRWKCIYGSAADQNPNMNARPDPEKPTDEPTVKPQPQWKLLQPVSVGDIWYPAGVILDLDRILVPGCLDLLRPTDQWVAIPLAVECSPHTGHPRWKCIEYGSAASPYVDFDQKEEGEDYDVGGGHA